MTDDERLHRPPQYIAGEEELPGDPPEISAAIKELNKYPPGKIPFDRSGDPAPAETSHSNGNGHGSRPTPIVVPPADLAPEPAPGPEPERRSAADLAAEMADEICDQRPILKHLHTYARSRGVAPLAVVAVAMARYAAMVPAGYVLPPLVGVAGTLNMFVALVGESGAGKGAAHGVAAEALHNPGWVDPISGEMKLFKIGIGSGEGLLHSYVYWEKNSKKLERLRESAFFTAAEVDKLTALGPGRAGSTLMSMIREMYSGEELSFAYADPTKRLAVEEHSYRGSMTIGVQPLKAGPLFEDADGGTPQRIFWVPVRDPKLPHIRERPPTPPPVPVAIPAAPAAGTRRVIPVAAVVEDEIDDSHWNRNHGIGDPLDGHSLYTRVKVAAVLALFEGRLAQGVTDDDWRVAGLLMKVSDATRDEVQRELASRASAENRKRGAADGNRELSKDAVIERDHVARATQQILAYLWKHDGESPGGWCGHVKVLRAVGSKLRYKFTDAIDLLTESGQIEVDATGAGGKYRRRR